MRLLLSSDYIFTYNIEGHMLILIFTTDKGIVIMKWNNDTPKIWRPWPIHLVSRYILFYHSRGCIYHAEDSSGSFTENLLSLFSSDRSYHFFRYVVYVYVWYRGLSLRNNEPWTPDKIPLRDWVESYFETHIGECNIFKRWYVPH